MESGIDPETKRLRQHNDLLRAEVLRLRAEVSAYSKDACSAWMALFQEFDARVVVPWGEMDDAERLRRSAIIRTSWRDFPPTGRRFLEEPK